ncbi:MAG: hypothetical protein H0T53_14765 [Herpetosiphonaceae bacterium]|nr:hypothetical protein [Herpetosiphonaceae bacterium]
MYPSPNVVHSVFLPLIMAPVQPLPEVRLNATTYRVGEHSGQLPLIVNLNRSVPYTVTVDYFTMNGTATAGSDYTAISGTLTFTPGQIAKNLSLAIMQDSAIEENETLTVQLHRVRGAQYGLIGASIVTIVDDDAVVQVQPTLSITGVTATRAYEWGVNVNPTAEVVDTAVGQTRTVDYAIKVERQALGPVNYQVRGILTTTNTGNAPAELAFLDVEVQYQLQSTTIYSTVSSLPISPALRLIPVGGNRTWAFTTTWTFDTADGTPPLTLSSLNLIGRVGVTDRAGPSLQPWTQTKPIARPLPMPVITAQSVTVTQQGAVEPGGVATWTSNNRSYTVTSVLQWYTTYTVTRVLNTPAMLAHTINLSEAGVTVMAETALQPTASLFEPTLEFRDITPRVTHTNEAIPFSAVIRARTGFGLNLNGIQLVERTAGGTLLRTLGTFVDDGLHGDELANDGIMGWSGSIQWSTTGIKYLAVATTLGNGQPMTSAAPPVEIVQSLPEQDWTIYFNTLEAASSKYTDLQYSHPFTVAQPLLLNWVRTQPGVAAASLDNEETISITYTSGLNNSVWVGDPDQAILGSGAAIQALAPAVEDGDSARLTSAPSTSAPLTSGNAAPSVFTRSNQAIIFNTLPKYTLAELSQAHVTSYLRAAGYTVAVLYDDKATIPNYKNLDQYGVIHSLGHGTIDTRNRYWITTGHRVTAANKRLYYDDIDAGLMKAESRDGRTIFAVSPKFFDIYYAGKTLPNSLVTLIHCDSKILANTFMAMGAKGFIGFDDLIPADGGMTWGADGVNELYRSMVRNSADVRTAFSSIPPALRTLTYNRLKFGVYFETTVTMEMDPRSERLFLYPSGFTNGNFESGTLSGWSKRQGAWASAFTVPTWAQPKHGLYAAHIGKMIYPNACGTCGGIPATTDISQVIDMLPSDRFLAFDYAFSTYLPSTGWAVLELRSSSDGSLLSSVRLAQYPGSGWRGRADFWYTDIRHARIDLRKIPTLKLYGGHRVKIVFKNVQLNGNNQTFYLDNVRLEQE